MHSFLLVEKTPGGLSVKAMDDGWLKKQLEDHPDSIAHTRADGDTILLTATTDELQDFVLKHIDTDGAYGKPTELKRVESPPSAPPAAKP